MSGSSGNPFQNPLSEGLRAVMKELLRGEPLSLPLFRAYLARR